MQIAGGLARRARCATWKVALEAAQADQARSAAWAVPAASGAAAFAAFESRPEVRQTASERHASLPAEEVPAMAAVAPEFTAALGGDQAFELGLVALLDGIELRANQ